MRRATVVVSAVVVLFAVQANAGPVETSVNRCQLTAQKEVQKYAKYRLAAIDSCLGKAANEVLSKDRDISRAVPLCITQFRKLYDSRGLGKGLEEKLRSKIAAKCVPGNPPVQHTLGDVIGVGASVTQPIQVNNLDTFCPQFGGDGSVDDVNERVDCMVDGIKTAQEILVVVQYPRAFEWLAALTTAFGTATPPNSDPTKVQDALVAIQNVF